MGDAFGSWEKKGTMVFSHVPRHGPLVASDELIL